jgi:hypothetical protein
MKRKVFEVPPDLIVDFAQIIEDNELDNVIEGVTDDGDIEITVEFNPKQKEAIKELGEMIDDYHEEEED